MTKPSRTRGTREPGQSGHPTEAGDARAFSRRRLLGTATATGVAGLAAGAASGAIGHAAASEPAEPALSTLGATSVPFHGTHQPGITTPLQSRGQLVAFDLAAGAGRRGAAALLRRWSTLAAELMAGRPDETGTGIANDAGPASLTFTFGFGHGFFDATGLTALRPEALRPLPTFSNDALDEGRSHGDLWVQIGADDPLVAFDALRAVQRAAAGTARLRWQMTGFHRSPGATARPMTARNLMGQVDGTNNPSPDDPDFARHVFVPADGEPAWMAHGSYAVVRRIRMLLDDWENLPAGERDRVLGRRGSDGAPLTGGSETTPVDLAATHPDGSPVIAADAHVRVTAPESNGGATMLRRSFSYHDGPREDGAPDAGLLFVCWQADPLRSFVTVQRKLDRGDALSTFVRHEASGLFAVPGGAAEGEYVGQRLVES